MMKRKKALVLLLTLALMFSLGAGSALAQNDGRDTKDDSGSGGGGGGNNGGGNNQGGGGSSSDTGGSSSDSGGSSGTDADGNPTNSDDGRGGSGDSSSSDGNSSGDSSNPDDDGNPSTLDRLPDGEGNPTGDGNSASEPFVTEIIPIGLPADGCWATPAYDSGVWLRPNASTDLQAIGQMLPGQAYQGNGLVSGQGGMWLELSIDGGMAYAAGSFLRTSGCPEVEFATDDVVVDGQIVTAQDYDTARAIYEPGDYLVYSMVYLGAIDPQNPGALIVVGPDNEPVAIELENAHVSSFQLGVLDNDAAQGFEDTIDVLSWSWGMTQSGTFFEPDNLPDAIILVDVPDEPVAAWYAKFGDIEGSSQHKNHAGLFGDLGNDWIVGGAGQTDDDGAGNNTVFGNLIPVYFMVDLHVAPADQNDRLIVSNIGSSGEDGIEGQDGTDLLIVNNGDGSDFFEYDSLGSLIMEPADPNSIGGVGMLIFVLLGDADGDYNEDGLVNAADYTVWRDSSSSGVVDSADYLVWRDNFGQSQSMDAEDYDVWRSTFGATIPPSSQAGGGVTIMESIVTGNSPSSSASTYHNITLTNARVTQLGQ